MKNSPYNLIFAVLLVGATFVFAEQQGITKSYKVSKGVTLDVSVNPGDIIIKSWDKNEISFNSKDMDANDWRNVEFKEIDNTLYFNFRPKKGWGNFTFFVPSVTHLRLRTTNGDIELKNKITGDVDLRTSGGDLITNEIQGRLTASTSGGDIHLGDISGPINVNTSGGDIIIGSVSGNNAEVNTMGGDIQIIGTEGNLNAKTYGGDITIGDIGGNAFVTTFGGDVELKNVSGKAIMETYGGDISLLSANGHVSAETKGGDISLKNVKGSLDAKTSGGSIYAELDPAHSGQSNLKSANGQIELRLSPSSKVDIDALIKMRGSHEQGSRIYTDFGGKTNLEKNKNTISYKTAINGGGQQINISTTNSDIIIKKK
ncbi:MAG: hypothetical protein CVV23_01735 [Ignavibacteriae bacterium HGW-Ignavibacteriae-2]|jgi:DUF4097 and DUF4098 domain-containing protein YvlB|nr:MAG: hypothetical protein CVV23_01735 [Ignavibacteriae bacterium HGW-Ignavibacteriae-2]